METQGIKGTARRKVYEKVDAQKSFLSSGLEKLADSVAHAGEDMQGPEAKVAQQVARYVRKAHEVIEGKSTEDLVDGAVREVKERPAVMLAGAFTLGFIGARFLRS
ncbi:MAG: hypothetical protein IRZ16_01885 [Myxococcaceae bacterium]|nr:hypothetical protein [Myxococcaceae bacterium]